MVQLCPDLVALKESGAYQNQTGTEHWKVLPECPKQRFSVAVVNGQLVAIGGRHLGKDKHSSQSLTRQTRHLTMEVAPSMTYCRRNPVVVTTNTSLIVAGGWEKREVEAMDTQTLKGFTVATLPHPLSEATVEADCILLVVFPLLQWQPSQC